jgi:prepilin-type N-terminal cleavage/methylation domain-containing protein
MKRSYYNGFTMIEILVVTTIIAVLTAIGSVSYASVTKKSRDSKRKSDVEQIRAALEMYRADNGNYINGSGAATSILSVLVSSFYMPKIPVDPKNVEYGYTGTNCVGATCHGYTVQTTLEGYTAPAVPPENTCTPVNPYNYCMKNP